MRRIGVDLFTKIAVHDFRKPLDQLLRSSSNDFNDRLLVNSGIQYSSPDLQRKQKQNVMLRISSSTSQVVFQETTQIQPQAPTRRETSLVHVDDMDYSRSGTPEQSGSRSKGGRTVIRERWCVQLPFLAVPPPPSTRIDAIFLPPVKIAPFLENRDSLKVAALTFP